MSSLTSLLALSSVYTGSLLGVTAEVRVRGSHDPVEVRVRGPLVDASGTATLSADGGVVLDEPLARYLATRGVRVVRVAPDPRGGIHLRTRLPLFGTHDMWLHKE